MTWLRPQSIRFGIALQAPLLALVAAAPLVHAQNSDGSASWHDVSLADYRQHLEQLDSNVAACRAQVARKVPVPASDNACDPNRVGSDDRVSGTGANSPAREVRYDWLRTVLARAGDRAAAPSPGIHLIPGAQAPPPSVDNLLAEAQARLQNDEKQAGSPAEPASNYASQRAALNAILSQRAYQGTTQASPVDRFREWLYNQLDKFLASLVRFGSRSRWIVWSLRVLLVLGICVGLVWAIVRIERGSRIKLVPDIVPSPDSPSAREWQLWLADARAMAQKGQWRDAIHFVYWAAIARLESRRLWPADRARTPREYLRLMPGADPRTPTLTALTRSFERTWYGGRAAESGDFETALELAVSLGVKAE
jgi:Domain of unknown function (DUF4129)